MKAKFRITLLALISFTLMGCPAGNFYRYTFVDTSTKQDTSTHTRISYDENTELNISCGNYVQFIRTRKRGILATIKVVSKTEDKKEQLIKNVISSTYGTLIRTSPFELEFYMLRDTVDMLYFDLPLNDVSHREINKSIKKDTISIELQNGKELLFVKIDPK